MKLVISHALPPAAMAQALLGTFSERHPKIIHAFNSKQAHAEAWPLHRHGCTPAEGLSLTSMGFKPDANQTIGAGLGPLHAQVTASESPVWIAEFCATVISQERATVLPLTLLDASPSDIAALEDCASTLFSDDGDGIGIEPLGKGLWRIHADFPPEGQTISPLALMGQDLGDWWPTADAWRGWRKRVNEIQMAWHDHPVNQARQKQGLAAINNVWLYGGARGFEPEPNAGVVWIDDLAVPAWRGDWSGWLAAWSRIEPALLGSAPEHEIVLTGEDRLVRLSNSPSRWWSNLFAKSPKNTWRRWWLNQNSP